MSGLIRYFAALACLSATAAMAVPNSYTYLRTIDISPATQSISRFTGTEAAPAGGFYLADNGGDNIAYIPTPLTASGATNNAGDVPLLATDAFGNGVSFTAVAYDGTDLYASGQDTAGWHLIKFSGAPTGSATPVTFTEPAGNFNGADVVGTGKLVAPGTSDGSLNFFNVSGSTVTAAGSVTASGLPAGSRFVRAVADLAHNRIFVAGAATSQTGQVIVYTSNGTAAGTSYSAAANPVVAGSATNAAPNAGAQTYQGMDYDAEDQVLCVAKNAGTSGADGWALYDVSTAGTNKTAFQFIDGTTTPDGAVADNGAYGCGFFKVGSEKYLAVAKTGKIYIFKQNVPSADVKDWSIYE